MRIKLLFIFFFFLSILKSYSQCDPSVPTFTVNLTGSPAGTWTSPIIARNGNCCGTLAPNKCIDFIITLDPGAVGISFNIISGAIPGGALFYQIGCGPPTALGTPICLTGPGPHLLTFCKPGNNANVYQITSIPAAVGGTNITINDGCVGHLNATGFNTSTVSWNSIFPGASGAYNSYLSCTNCVNPTVTGTGTLPAYVDYVICGLPASTCMFTPVCDTVRVTFNPTLSVSIVPINPTICFGSGSTTITAVGSGGTPPYSYLWNGVNSSASITVGAGTFTVQLSDASGCPPTFASVTVTAFSVPITANAGPDDTICSQSPSTILNGSVTGASGGVWSGGSGTFSPNNATLVGAVYTPTAAELAAGLVTLTLTTTGNGTCPAATDAVTIHYMGFTGTVAITPTNVSCFGGNNGSAVASVTGGISPYSYSWNTVPAQTTATANNLIAGTYTVTLTNGIGCTTQTSTTITQPPPLSVSNVITNVSCSGGNNGSIAITPAGGTPAYSYLWAPGGQTTSSISGQAAGTYTITVTDAKGCVLTSNYTITQPAPLAVTFTQTNVSCFGGSNGTASATVTGGTTSYTYSWAPSGGTASTASGLIAGTYTLTVTDSKGCIVTGTVIITQPTALVATTSITNETCDYLNNGTATANPSGGTPGYTYTWLPGGLTSASINSLPSGTYTLTVTDAKGCVVTAFATITQPATLAVSLISQTNVSCFGGNNGSVTASPSGGTPAYSYSWIPGGAVTATASTLTAGTYTVTVTDNNDCQIQSNTTITQPTPLSVTNVITNVSCSGGSNGSISLTPSGGTPAYSYLWTPGGQTTSSISGQTAGTYTVSVTDSKGCVLTSNYTITQPAPLAVTFTQTNVSCFGGSNGTASATVTGGTASYTYSWAPSGGTASTASGLIAGTYTLTVTDAKGCIVTGTVIITQPSTLTATTSVTNETCDYLNNGTATANPLGGTPGYTYSWLPGGSTSASISSLASATYTVTVTDAKGCVALATAVITQPPTLSISFNSIVNVSCFGGNNGSVNATPAGGTPNYSYSWMPGGATTNSVTGLSAGTYTLTITDNNGCQVQNTVTITQPIAPLAVSGSSTPTSCFGGSNGTATASASGGTVVYTYLWMPGGLTGSNVSGLTAGTYTVTATDANSCSTNNTILVNQPSAAVLTTSTINSNCGAPTGQASVSVTGGVPPYTYSWSPSGGTGSSATGLLAGPYTVQVTDANGCISTQWANVNDNSGPTATIFSIINVTCFGGSDGAASVGVAGGTGPFTYNWTPFGGSATTATGLTAGTYTVTVQDANGCISNATTSPDITQPPPIAITVTTGNVSCFGGSNGTATALATGGTPGYSYLWQPSGTSGSSISGLSANSYTVQTTDNNGCTQSSPFTITQPLTPLAVSASATPASCFGGSNGTTNAIASGGTGPYNYSWMPGGIAGSGLAGMTAGTYTVNVTDAQGCITNTTTSVTQPTAISLTTGSNNAACGTASGLAFVSSSGGTPAYTYSWSPGGSANDTAFSLLPGTYSVTVTDNNSCVASITVAVNNTPGPIASIASTTNVSCNAGSNGSASVTLSGGVSPFTYSWSPSGGSGPIATGLVAGTYTINVTDANGCPSSASTTITQPTAIAINVVTTNVSCFGGNNGTASVTAFGGTPGFTYTWLPSGSSGSTINSLTAGAYTVQATDANSCTQTAPFSITQPTVLSASIISSSNVSCFGGNNGTAAVSVSGGTPFYSYNWLPSGGTGASASGLSVGTYTVNITDANSCTTSATVIITQPSMALSASGTGSVTSCFGGSNGTGNVLASGGTASYSYLWTPSGGTGSSASGLSAGTYDVLVTDLNGCQTNTSVTITQPSAIAGTLSTVNPSCGLSNGSISSMVSGGTGPYSYSWTPGSATTPGITSVGPGNYTLLITDANSCTSSLTATLTNIVGPNVSISSTTNVSCFGGNNGSATASVSSGTAPYMYNWSPTGGTGTVGNSLTAGSYTVTVTDNLGCTNTAVAVITQPAALGISISSNSPVSCNGGNNGAISVSGTGGTPTYTYLWSPVASSSPSISGLSAGTYSVNVTDLNGCSTSISIPVTQPAVLTSSIGSSTNVLCYNGTNGSAFVSVSGGTIPYSYLWSNGQTGSTASTLTAGSYTVTVTDVNGCSSTSSILITQPTQVITSAGPNDTICLGSSGVVTATATGGAGGYYYAWLPGPAINSGLYTITPGTTTTYTVVAYDMLGCMGTVDTVTAIVYSLTAANIDAIAFSPICPGQSTVVYAQTTGITGPLTYSWNNGLGSGPGGFLVTPAAPTTYVVTVTNVCGTTVTDSVSVTFNPPPTLVLSSDTDSLCAPGSIQFNDSSITGNASDPITSWLWTFGDGSTSTLENPSHTYPSPGNYPVTLTVTTSGGCTSNNASAPLTIFAHPYPIASFSINSNILDLPYDMLITNNSSVGATSYIWSFGDGGTSTQTNPQYQYTTIGTYPIELIATNAYNCSDTAYGQVMTNSDLVFPNVFTPNDNGSSGGFYDITSLTNDVFFPYTSGVVDFKLQIFNRWGELIFESNDIKQGWDGYYHGKLCEQDVYIWKAYAKLNNGKKFNKTGDVTLLR